MKQNFNLISNIELPISYRTIVEQKRKEKTEFLSYPKLMAHWNQNV